jgi:sugar phosphate isomerase/epimerase
MNIYISTGGFSRQSADLTVNDFARNGIKNIELSGGSYKKNLFNILKNKKLNFQIHNYFPPPKIPFVLNIASTNKKIYQNSLKLILRAINFSHKLGSSYYSFHAGFLCDINPQELGNRIKKKKLNPREICKKLFIDRVGYIAKKANKLGIKIMIENNVITKSNIKEFGENPFLMSEPSECREILKKLPRNVGMLVDVAHLKVSANTIGFHPKTMFDKCNKRIFGYHLSDNDGKKDTNNFFTEKSWFWKHLDKRIKYFSIEVYKAKPLKLLKILNLAEKKLGLIK